MIKLNLKPAAFHGNWNCSHAITMTLVHVIYARTLSIASVDLSTIVREVSEQWRELMAARNLAFTREVTDEEITVLGDRNALQRLLTVLLDNAAK
jgi:signal transduction histidine kinase